VAGLRKVLQERHRRKKTKERKRNWSGDREFEEETVEGGSCFDE